jgi:hypothetical protein
MKQRPDTTRIKHGRNGLGIAAIAFWQFAAFLMLILLVWTNGVLDLPYILFGRKKAGLDTFECWILTCATIVTAIVTVGQTYLRHKRLAASLVTVCSACHKVRITPEAWEAVEDFVSENSRITFSHGLCPECFRKSLDGLADDRGDQS